MHVVTMGLLWCLRGESMVLHDVSVVSPWRLHGDSLVSPVLYLNCLDCVSTCICYYGVYIKFWRYFHGVFIACMFDGVTMDKASFRLGVGGVGGRQRGTFTPPWNL